MLTEQDMFEPEVQSVTDDKLTPLDHSVDPICFAGDEARSRQAPDDVVGHDRSHQFPVTVSQSGEKLLSDCILLNFCSHRLVPRVLEVGKCFDQHTLKCGADIID